MIKRALASRRKKRLVLLDAHAIIHRAYHAIPELTGPTGAPAGALYGLVSMLLKIISDLEPDYLVACYDLPKPTIRHAAYEGYKATREKADDSLVSQIVESRRVFAAFAIPIYEREGFEADDILGTIAADMADNKDTEVIIASGDMDTLQLIRGDSVRVYTLKKGLNDTILYDEDAVIDRFGFAPNLIPDWKGLCGDASDNIPGVRGIGEKTATELIKKFGPIESVYAAVKKGESFLVDKWIKKRTFSLLKENKEDAMLSKSLAIIRTDAPISFSLPAQEWKNTVDAAVIVALLDEFGFRSLRERTKKALALTTQKEASFEDSDAAAREEYIAINDDRLKEAAVMLWLISSEFTNPSLEDVRAFTKENLFDKAYVALEREIREMGRVNDVYENIEKPLIPVIDKMESRGVLIDTEALKQLATQYRSELNLVEKRIHSSIGHEFNISSPKQLGEVLFDEMQLIPKKQKRTAGGARSTRESELEKIRDSHPIINDVLEYRELKKMLTTYIENIPPLLDDGGRLHADFVQTGTTTGRMASQNPNLQNIPNHFKRGQAVRRIFTATPGFDLVAIDYSQIELRIAAILSGDEKLCAIFSRGRDVHAEVAASVFGVPAENVDLEMRRRAKVVNFGILYGMGVNALRQQLGSSTDEASRFLEEYFHTFSTLAEYLESTKKIAREHGYTETLFGRRRQFPEMKSPLPYVRAQAERMAINAPIQGTQADVIKLAMVEIDRMIEREAKNDAHLLLQVHDELVYEIRSEQAESLGEKIKKIMESVLPQSDVYKSLPTVKQVPVLADLKKGPNWGNLK